jgi:tetratricopeptide (TPR) repeat protein
MKKQLLIVTIGLLSIASFAQKSELKAAEKALKKGQFKEAKAFIASLESIEASLEPKYIAKYYYLKGTVYGTSNVKKAADAYNKLFEYEKQTGKLKYTEEAKFKLSQLAQFLINKAIEDYNNKDFKKATENFYFTYKLSPIDTSFLYNAAMSSYLSKDYDLSLAYFKELQNINYTGIVTSYLALNKETGKEETFESKSQRDLMVKTDQYSTPRDNVSESKQAEIVKNIGYIYVNQGKSELAIAAIEEARKSNPKDMNLLLNQAQMYIKLERMDKFGELMTEAVALDPTNPMLFFNLGVVNANENKTDAAIGFYKKAIELDPSYGDAYFNLGIAMLGEEKAIVDEMNNNLSNFKKYDELQAKQKALYEEVLPYLVKADNIKRSEDTVRMLLTIYDTLEKEAEADVLRPIYKEMRTQ